MMEWSDKMYFLWQLSLFVSAVSLVVGCVKKSWAFLLISTVTFMPIAWYFSGAKNALKYISLIPILLLVLTILIWYKKKEKIVVNN